ncbi:hypothetical protein DW106_05525 [Ruminococcus sp. AM09-18-1]|nr:hypothetical protein DW106_05525 [Ruminococcus sp. AM09-18-1]
MLNNGYRYVKNIIEIEKFLKDTGNRYMLISQRHFKGKFSENGECEIPEGTTLGLQILEDHSEPVIDKLTGEEKPDNTLETFEVTVVGSQYPLPIKKGSKVRLYNFMPEFSYYINFNFILRFGKVEEIKEGKDATN